MKKPTCPRDVPPEVKKQFAQLVDLMDGRATKADEVTLLLLATSYVTWRQARVEVARLGNVVMSGGTAIANPSLAIAHQAQQEILALCRELGLTAASRRKLCPDEKPHQLPRLRATGA